MMNCYASPSLLHVLVASFIVLSTHSHLALTGVLAQYDHEYDHHDEETEYSYIEATGRGPSRWGQLDPKWKACSYGRKQSPIDFVDRSLSFCPSLGELNKDYRPAPATLTKRGREIYVYWSGDAGKININGSDYRLIQLHWHTPAEHTFNGIKYDLELHIVHSNSTNGTAVVGIVYRLGPPDPFLSTLTEKIKLLQRDGNIDLGIVDPKSVGFRNREYYYRYLGSLTTPPCTEGVVWTVFRHVRTVSWEQVQALKDAIEYGFESNARPTQPLNGRPVCLYAPFYG
ncbi:alpha carbonic anhydrase 4 [Ziziphus jujuba]|uniref:Alpha carbonic anhydrase 4 n=1 Tax=Ziziphus jujuba TaxID=326968 RepID=A0ABM3I7B1_ZIZJJ|nr:alpha carbonic anhydrase 4 [Ziziphus jujuba]